ncbi:MAG: nucleotidyltransferase family protein, partial [Firmicutes bacterium]|nr:nucleotidyltransferase family protein [Candidatus Colimorpha enterica]
PRENERIYGYYADVWERLMTDDGVRFYFSDEDFYVYSIVHTYKHYSGTGTGLRSLLDIYVLNNLFGEKYDRKYIEDETAKLGISDFEKKLRELSNKVFGGCEYTLTEEEEETVAYFAGSGTYGNYENRVTNAFRTKYPDGATGINKVKYVLSRLFPSAKWFKANYPACEKHPILIPFYAVRRLFVTGIRRKGAVMNELDAVMKAEKSDKEE